MINEAARQYWLTIGGVDYSAQMVSFSGTTAHLSGQAGGFCQFEGGVLVLDEGVEPIDPDMDLALFEAKTPIALQVKNPAGSIETFPHAVQIERAAYDPATRTTTIQCVDKLTAAPDREATNVFVSGVSVGTPLAASAIIANCLFATGITTSLSLSALGYFC
ncbi:MAG: hypothetical protein HC771_22960 [Synechococcales cyanobacterium CRU_2_2]|nr:hypothetical protein [Synechococcales cyanobacterium CRU_2_2]